MMSRWTSEAEQIVEAYLSEVRRKLPHDVDDADEIIDSLKQHLLREAEGIAAPLITEEHARRAIALLGTAEEVAAGWGHSAPAQQKQPASAPVHAPPARTGRIAWYLSTSFITFSGVVLPTAAIAAEFLFAFMRQFYADPMPSLPLMLGLISVPAGFGGLLWLLNRKADPQTLAPRTRRLVFLLAGWLMGFTLSYSIFYLLTIPLALLALLLFGFGLLGLSPHLAFLASLRMYRMLLNEFTHDTAERSAARRLAWRSAGVVLALAALSLARLVAIEHAMQLAASTDPAEEGQGVRLLQWTLAEGRIEMAGERFQSRDEVELFGEERFTPWGTRWLASRTEAQRAYFALTGQLYREVAVNRMTLRNRWGLIPNSFFARDTAQGEQRVGAELDNLSLKSSQLDGTVFAAADGMGEATAYVEWIMTFHNDLDFPQEARCMLELPPGGVASRLTLWINGEEQEAAFGGRGQTTAAYQDVAVVRRQDPALLTTAGPDRVMLQCFPVPARGEMKVKVGITAPLVVRDDKALLQMPRMVERNFQLNDNGRHLVWMESPAPLQSDLAALKAETAGQVHALRGEVPMDGPDGECGFVLHCPAPALPAPVTFTAALGDVQGSVTLRTATPSDMGLTGPMWLVVDGGAAMAEAAVDWQGVLDAFPQGTEWHVRLCHPGIPALTSSAPEEIAEWLNDADYRGGRNPVHALQEAWLEASATEHARLLWVHGPYPMNVFDTSPIEQALRRRPAVATGGLPRILDVQVTPGPNAILAGMQQVPGVLRVPVIGGAPGVAASLASYARHGSFDDLQRTYALTADPAGLPGSGHVVRLTAYNTVFTGMQDTLNDTATEEIALAVKTRLVTPVSGAVVLENMGQYKRHDLDPGENQEAIAQVPAIPEPEEWALIIVALCAVAFVLLRRKQSSGLQWS